MVEHLTGAYPRQIRAQMMREAISMQSGVACNQTYPRQIRAHNRRRVLHDRVLAREVESLAHLMREAISMQSDVIRRARKRRSQSEALPGSPS
jgi:hypothetical protein